ncbi:hypothetical protein ACFPM0_11570 [Pseudonocardia sulfidoxydans]|uniref:hypothetical protein n=1 Tax=Pseudonocardia sulfidoxydans TaxID=54011 RepID=UPI003608436C
MLQRRPGRDARAGTAGGGLTTAGRGLVAVGGVQQLSRTGSTTARIERRPYGSIMALATSPVVLNCETVA